MSHFLPQTDNPVGSDVLLIDTRASVSALLCCAEQRFQAAKNLLRSLSHLSAASSAQQELNAVCEATALLLQEGCDVLGVVVLRSD